MIQSSEVFWTNPPGSAGFYLAVTKIGLQVQPDDLLAGSSIVFTAAYTYNFFRTKFYLDLP